MFATHFQRVTHSPDGGAVEPPPHCLHDLSRLGASRRIQHIGVLRPRLGEGRAEAAGRGGGRLPPYVTLSCRRSAKHT
ncbi:hypothetical protein MTO96_025717 [Rhipicephalus appendiculatus]